MIFLGPAKREKIQAENLTWVHTLVNSLGAMSIYEKLYFI